MQCARCHVLLAAQKPLPQCLLCFQLPPVARPAHLKPSRAAQCWRRYWPAAPAACPAYVLPSRVPSTPGAQLCWPPAAALGWAHPARLPHWRRRQWPRPGRALAAQTAGEATNRRPAFSTARFFRVKIRESLLVDHVGDRFACAANQGAPGKHTCKLTENNKCCSPFHGSVLAVHSLRAPPGPRTRWTLARGAGQRP